ncbi:hypothetical protein ERJ75_001306700 [Trypanosoma vivax]|nr:hypothetical protein ERJ75_001306700 [Trypanosoma vivax]
MCGRYGSLCRVRREALGADGWEWVRSAWHARGVNNLAALWHNGAFNRTGRAGTRSCGCDRVRYEAATSDVAREKGVPAGALGRRFEQLREVDDTRVKDALDTVKLHWAPPKAVGKDKGPRPLFNGHNILRRARITRADAEEGQRQLSLQKVNVWTLPLEWASRALNNKALRRFAAVWCNVLRSLEPHSCKREPNLGISEADSGAMEGAGVIFEASRKPAEVFVVSLAVVEGKAGGPRRRFIALPKGKNDHDDCEAEAPLQHASCYLRAVFGEVAAVFDMKASFFQVSLPQGSRTSFRCRTEAGRLAELTRLKMGYKRSPQMLHTATRALAGDHAIVSSRCAAPQSLKIHVWIDNIQICGPRRNVEKRSRVATRNARQCAATLGESNYLSKKHEFIGVHFGRETGTVCQSQKTIRKLREAPPLEGLTAAELERLTSRMVCAAGVRGGALLE